jgi:hypothetical protein
VSGVLKKIMADKKGSAVVLFGTLLAVILFTFGMLVVEWQMLLICRNKAEDALAAAELAALGTADREALGYGVMKLPEGEAWSVFLGYLIENIEQNLGRVLAGEVEIEEFIIYNPGSYPAVCPRGSEIKETAVHAVITVPIRRPVFRGLLGDTVNMTIHLDSDSIFTGL